MILLTNLHNQNKRRTAGAIIVLILVFALFTASGCANQTGSPIPAVSSATPTATTVPKSPTATNPPTPTKTATILIPVTGATETPRPTPEPSISGKISLWAELEQPDLWAIYAYDLASGSAERLTKTIQTYEGFVEPNNQWTIFTGYEYVWSPNGKLLAVDILEPETNIIDVYDITTPATAPEPYLVLPGREPSFHPETYRIAYIDKGINTLITDGTVPMILSYKDCQQLLYSPSEDYILCEANFINKGEFYFYAVFEYEFTRVSYVDSAHLIFPQFSPDGRYLSFFNIQFLERKLTLIDITTPEFPQINIAEYYAVNQKDAKDYTWHPNSQQIALIEAFETPGEYGITVFDLTTGEIIFRSKPGNMENLSWSPDGRFLAYRAANGASGDSLVILDAENDFVVAKRIKFEGSVWYPAWIPEQIEP